MSFIWVYFSSIPSFWEHSTKQTLDYTFKIIWQEKASLDSVQLIWYPACADCLHCCCPLYTQRQMWDSARGFLLLLDKDLEQRQKGIFSEISFTNLPQESA